MATPEVEFSILAGSGVPVRALKQGEVIFREGDPAKELYVIKSGRVDITSGNRLLATLGDNGIFGEMALIDKEPRSATVTAATDVEIVAGRRAAVPVPGQPDAVLRAQGHARARRSPAGRQQGGLT